MNGYQVLANILLAPINTSFDGYASELLKN